MSPKYWSHIVVIPIAMNATPRVAVTVQAEPSEIPTTAQRMQMIGRKIEGLSSCITYWFFIAFITL